MPPVCCRAMAPDASPAPEGVATRVAEGGTAVGGLRPDDGYWHYRQYDAVALARSRSFEDVWCLLVDGALPAAPERDAFAAEVRPLRRLPGEVLDVLPAVAASSDSPMAAVRTLVSLLGAVDGMAPTVDVDRARRRRDALRLAAALPTLVMAVHRLRHGLRPVEPDDGLGHGANTLWMLAGEVPGPETAAALDAYLIAAADHGFNTSTFAARVVTSSGADVAAAVVAAIGALSGPRHGGAPSRALDLLDAVASPGDIRPYVESALAAGRKLPGFGHRVYRGPDPRAVFLRELAGRVGASRAGLAAEVERAVVDVLAERKPGSRLGVNMELYAGVVMDHCGVPRELFAPLFACARSAGWAAHILEQADGGRIIRPTARYAGPPPPEPVPEV